MTLHLRSKIINRVFASYLDHDEVNAERFQLKASTMYQKRES